MMQSVGQIAQLRQASDAAPPDGESALRSRLGKLEIPNIC